AHRHHGDVVTAQAVRLGSKDANLETGVGQAARQLTRRAEGGAAAGVHHQKHGAAHAGPSATARMASAGSSGAAPRASQRKYSTLPDGPGSALATTPRTPSPRLSAVTATAQT